MSLQSYWFQQIKDGHKMYEGRVYDSKRRKIQINDYIVFTNEDNDEKIIKKVKELHIFSSFEEMLNHISLSLILPGILSVEEGISIYHNIPLYKENALIYGVVAIEFY